MAHPTKADAVKYFLMAIGVPYAYIVYRFMIDMPVRILAWVDFVKFHYGIVASALWAHQTYFVVLFSVLIKIAGPNRIWRMSILNGFLVRLFVFIIPFVSGCVWKGPCSFWTDSMAVNASRLWWYDNGVLGIASMSIAIIEGVRYDFNWRTIVAWVFGMLILGHETLLPLFLMNLRHLEITVDPTARKSFFDKAWMWYLALGAYGVATWYGQVFEYVARGGAIFDEWHATIFQVGGSTMTPSAALNLLAVFLLFGPVCVYALPLWEPVPSTWRAGRVTPNKVYHTARAWLTRYRFCMLGFSSVATALILLFYFREFEPDRVYYRPPVEGDMDDPDDDGDYKDDTASDTDDDGAGDHVADAALNELRRQRRQDASDGLLTLVFLFTFTMFLAWVMVELPWVLPVFVVLFTIVLERTNPFLVSVPYINAMHRTYPRVSKYLVWALPIFLAIVRHITVMREYLHGIFQVMNGEAFFTFASHHFESWSWFLSTLLIGFAVVYLMWTVNYVNNDQGPGRHTAPVGSSNPVVVKVVAFVTVMLLIGLRSYSDMNSTCDLNPGQQTLEDDVVYDDLKFLLAGRIANGYVRRGQHGKVHGCVKGTFRSYPRVPSRLRHGVFANGTEFDAWVRFSSGHLSDRADSIPDVRGVAVKLTGVPGQKVLENDEVATQDFLFVSSPTFFTDTVLHYTALVKAMDHPNIFVGLLSYAIPSIYIFDWDLGTPWRLLKMAIEGGKIRNPFVADYYSTTAYRLGLGDQAVRYSLRPCPGTHASAEQHERDLRHAQEEPVNFLQDAMVDTLERSDVCMEVLVQEQGDDPCENRIERPTQEWKGKWSVVGTLTIPRQDFMTRGQMDHCRSMAFTPWHSLPEHAPLGSVNYARKVTYLGSSSVRRADNGDSVAEPTGKENFSNTPKFTPPSVGAGDTETYQIERYPFPYNKLPPHIRKLPEEENFSSTKRFFLGDTPRQLNMHYAKEYLGLSFHGSFDHKFTSPDNFKAMFDDEGIMDPPSIVHCWQDDDAWMLQFIAGINPTMITSTHAPDVPPQDTLEPGSVDSMNAYMEENDYPSVGALHNSSSLFFADYYQLDNVQPKAGAVFYAPLVFMFFDTDANKLRPLGIRLDERRFFTPDNTKVWTFAKMHAAHSDALIHELNTHLVRTHLAMEPIILAFHRQLNAKHSLMIMMKPHFYETLAINEFGRRTLLASDPHFSVLEMSFGLGLKGGLKLMSEDYDEHFRLDELDFPTAMKKRGFVEVTKKSKDILPGYAYRDMGFKLWHSIKSYAHAVVHKVYHSDDDVARDEELQAMFEELSDPTRGAMKGVPDVQDRETLVSVLASIVFTMTAQHSSVNYGQKEFYSMVPNRPVIMHKAMPDDLQHVTDEYMVAALPTKLEATLWVVTTTILSLNDDLIFIPVTTEPTPESFGYPYRIPVKGEAPYTFRAEYNDFADHLNTTVAKEMEDYRQTWFTDRRTCFDYPWLMPNNVARSISV